jgi:hypothetical protein
MPGHHQDNLVALDVGKLMHLHEPHNVGPLMHDDTTPPEIPSGMKRFYKYPFIGRLFKFLAWWLIFSGIYASSSVCPFCGRLACPVGGASAGIVGGLFALVIGKGKVIIEQVTRRFSFIRSTIKSTREGRR